MGHIGDRFWRESFKRDRRQFDRTWRWAFPLAIILAVLVALATLAVYAGAAVWLVEHLQ